MYKLEAKPHGVGAGAKPACPEEMCPVRQAHVHGPVKIVVGLSSLVQLDAFSVCAGASGDQPQAVCRTKCFGRIVHFCCTCVSQKE